MMTWMSSLKCLPYQSDSLVQTGCWMSGYIFLHWGTDVVHLCMWSTRHCQCSYAAIPGRGGRVQMVMRVSDPGVGGGGMSPSPAYSYTKQTRTSAHHIWQAHSLDFLPPPPSPSPIKGEKLGGSLGRRGGWNVLPTPLEKSSERKGTPFSCHSCVIPQITFGYLGREPNGLHLDRHRVAGPGVRPQCLGLIRDTKSHLKGYTRQGSPQEKHKIKMVLASMKYLSTKKKMLRWMERNWE